MHFFSKKMSFFTRYIPNIFLKSIHHTKARSASISYPADLSHNNTEVLIYPFYAFYV